MHLPSHRWRLRPLPFGHRTRPVPLSWFSHIGHLPARTRERSARSSAGDVTCESSSSQSRDPALFPPPWGRGRPFVLPLFIFLKQYVIAVAADPPPSLLPLPHMGQRSAPFISLRFMRCKGLRLPHCPQPPPRDGMNEMLLVPPIPEAKQAQRRVKPSFHQTQLLKSVLEHKIFCHKTPRTHRSRGRPCCLQRLSLHPASLSAQPSFAHVRHSRNRKGIEGFGYSGFLGPLGPAAPGWRWALLSHPPL